MVTTECWSRKQRGYKCVPIINRVKIPCLSTSFICIYFCREYRGRGANLCEKPKDVYIYETPSFRCKYVKK